MNINIYIYELYKCRCLWMTVHLLRVAYLMSARWAWMCEGELALHPLHGDSFYSPYELAQRNGTVRCENAVYSTLKTLRGNVLQTSEFVTIWNLCFPLNIIFWIQAFNKRLTMLDTIAPQYSQNKLDDLPSKPFNFHPCKR